MQRSGLRLAPDTEGLPTNNIDRYGRTIDYLRISITDRCNLRCVYCMPPEGVQLGPKDELLSFEEIWRVAGAARRLGFRKFRITGGEPLVLKDILPFIEGLQRRIDGALLCMTTNAVQLAPRVDDLRRLGVARLNISLDTLNPERFAALTRRACLSDVLDGLDRAVAAGFERIKINAVIVPGFNEDDIIPLAELARTRPIDIRFIERMPLNGHTDEGFLGADEIYRRLDAHYGLHPLAPEDNRAAAQHLFGSSDLQGRIGLIAPRSNKFCATCNRMRLTPSGELKGCLLSEGTLDIRDTLRSGVSDDELLDLLRLAVGIKPLEYHNEAYGLDRSMSAIGG